MGLNQWWIESTLGKQKENSNIGSNQLKHWTGQVETAQTEFNPTSKSQTSKTDFPHM